MQTLGGAAQGLRPFDAAEFIAAEHDLHRRLWREMAALCRRADTADVLQQQIALVRCLADLLPPHQRDELGEIHRLLRIRELAGDDVERLFARLRTSHAQTLVMLEMLAAELDSQRRGSRPASPALQARLDTFASVQLADLAWEDGHLLPLLRMRFLPIDHRQFALRLNRRASRWPGERMEGGAATAARLDS